MRLPTILCLFIATANGINTTTSYVLPPIFASNTSSSTLLTHTFTSNATQFTHLIAPIYRNVTAGDAWVFPSSAKDLGARDMGCECFSPDYECCMPSSTSLAPFCMPNGSTCCGNTFCAAGESCCGGFCCAANTVCNVKLIGSGCCPTGAICSSPPTCYDHASSNCSNRASPPPQCCPPDQPFCRNFEPFGLGCYASSTTASSTSSVPAMTAASTSNIFASSASTSAKTVKEHTMTISVVSNGLGGLSLEFPTGSASGGLQGESTTYVLEWPATSNTAAVAVTISKSVHSTTRTTLSSTTETTSTTSTTTAQSTTPSSSSTPSAHSSSTQSLLCYDPNANSHSPCPTTTTSPVSSSTSDGGGFNPPGATIVNSQAPKLASFPSLDPLRNFVTSLRAFFQTACGKTILTFVPFACFVFFSLCLLRDHIVAERGRQDRQLQPRPRANIAKPSPRKRPNEPHADPEPQTDTTAIAPSPPPNDEIPQNQPGDTELELLSKTKDITVVKGSARPLLAPRLVRKGEISVVEGSGRPFVRGMRTHSLWEGMGLGKRGEGGAGGGDGGEGEA